MTEINLLARVFPTNLTKDGKTQYVDVQVDARDSRASGQTNLHLRSERVERDDNKPRWSYGVPYSTNQMAEIIKAAGPNREPIANKDGTQIGTVYGFKANVMPVTRGTGLVVNTKSVQPSDFEVDGDTLNNQFDSVRAAALMRAVQGRAPAAEQTGVAEQAKVNEPAIG
ncbi:hypothetical protein [Amycolatopsis sp. PS_44_ISF1]|uniref:hypothetical protein n=1 Tax=Amycolatopsis sp. PS_44_ISF1 TaxID=2974917 RepID=UPI0028DFD75C|nr:hypothetical protein [Amycolatopsis sp. PS_44_ISF1]MDT8913573.1 hypothetical protein [Amycolatopsis sp. PS_44_ISF1]